MTNIVLSPGQAEGDTMVGRFLKQDECRIGRITGYAGTGKTTLIKVLAEHYGTPTVLTPTGKAALRVGEATGLFGMTIHRFLYEPTEDPKTGKPIFKLKEVWDDIMLDMRGKLVLIDEASMVDKAVWTDLVKVANRVGFHLLLMGDLFQLPPVYKDEEGRSFSTLTIPTPFNVNLTEVVRQALDSPIIRASMMLRSGRPEYEAMETLEPIGDDVLIESLIEARALGGAGICFTNSRRHDLNTRIRAKLGLPAETLQKGEPVLVTQNNYQLNCWNGEVVDFGGWNAGNEPTARPPILVTDRYTTSSMEMHFGVGQVYAQDAVLSPEQFTGKSEAGHVGTWIIRKRARMWFKDTFHEEFATPYLDCNYGYALTCHKAQGSEWPEVIVVVEDRLSSMRGNEKKRWLYTAITRAKNHVRYCYVQE